MKALYSLLSIPLLALIFAERSVQASPSDLDPAFGGGGIVVTSITNSPSYDVPRSVEVLSDGKIVVCGDIREDDADWNSFIVAYFIARYLPTGELDASFGANGKIVTPFNSPDYASIGLDVAIQPDGKIIAVGISVDNFAAVRYNYDGTLDASFGTGGMVVTQVGNDISHGRSVTVQPDGKILVVGRGGLDPSTSGFATVRYNPNGSLDTAFGDHGIAITPFGNGYSYALKAMLQPNGKIVVAGQTGGNGSYDRHFALLRYNADGSLDPSFGAGGKVVQTFQSTEAYLTDAVLQPDGRVAVTGTLLSPTPPAMAIVRYNANGSVDQSFAANGIFTSPHTSFIGNGIVLQPDGKILSFGAYGNAVSGVLRLNTNGTRDTGFGSNGIATTNFHSGTSYGLAGAVQRNGRILFLGYTWSGGDVVVARFLGDSAVSNLATISGRVTTPGGLGLRNAVVTLTDQNGIRRTATTSSMGFYLIENVPSGETYTATVSSRRYRFAARNISVTGDLTVVDFAGLE